MSELEALKAALRQTDDEIAALLTRRIEYSENIAREKMKLGERLVNPADEEIERERVVSGVAHPLHRQCVREMVSQMQAASRKRQYQILEEGGSSGRLPFIGVDKLDTESIRVVYQGVPGAYSHAAMCSFFGEDVPCFHVEKWRDAMEAIADGEADYAILPIENSTAGIVADNYDLLVDFENYIVGHQMVKCEHVLMGLPGTDLSNVREVYSHQQALSQCKPYLDSHPQWKCIPWPNTAMAAKKVADEGDPTQVAVGSAFAAKLYGLEVLAEKIYSNAANTTRFIVVTNQRIFRRDAAHITICFELPHKSGSLYSILSHFIYNDLNMDRIESRPIPGQNWQYRFFIDFEGNLSQSSVKNALRGIRAEARNMKILGNY